MTDQTDQTNLPEVVRAPWTEEQVKNLAAWQASRVVHPFTCGGCRDRLDIYITNEFGHVTAVDDRLLHPTAEGWRCATCSYEQDWAYRMMTDSPPPTDWMSRLRASDETGTGE